MKYILILLFVLIRGCGIAVGQDTCTANCMVVVIHGMNIDTILADDYNCGIWQGKEYPPCEIVKNTVSRETFDTIKVTMLCSNQNYCEDCSTFETQKRNIYYSWLSSKNNRFGACNN